MNALIIEGTESSPKVVFDSSKSLFEMSGESRPEDVRVFFEPLLTWIDQFSQEIANSKSDQTLHYQFNFSFQYFNSSSAKQIMDIVIKLMQLVNKNPKKIQIIFHWHYDDDEILEAGEGLAQITKAPFKFINTII